jgi:Uma2 family endonuclease
MPREIIEILERLMSVPRKRFMTPEEYLLIERQSEGKNEYYAGEVFAMTGASREHNLIVTNVITILNTQLRERRCEVYPSDMRVKVPKTSLYTYPDVVVVCGEPEFDDEYADTLLDPTVIIEVLSPSTEAYDRGKKFEHYRQLESLREYLLIAQDEYRIEHYLRQPDHRWLFDDAHLAGDVVQIPSIECQLVLADVYSKVTFEK